VQSQVAYGGRSQLDHDPLVTPYLGPEALDSLGTVLPHFAVGEPGVVAAAIAQLRDAGASILCGSDAPNPGTTFGASLHEELALLVGAGLSPTAALTAATAATAARFGLTDRGRIAVGLRADLVLVDGDPTTEIARTRHISGIWRGGRRFDRDGYRRRIATIAAPVAARAPAGELGLVSDFENGPTARFGSSWTMSTTGASKAAVSVGAGAHGSSGALEISGDLVPGGGLAWAGALWKPGTKYWAPVDLSGKPGFSFLARGDGKPYAVLVFTRHGRMIPSIQSFQPGREFGPVRFTWSQFDGMNGSDVIAIGIVQTTIAGSFQLAIDDLTLQ
jgi:hypothetical protein